MAASVSLICESVGWARGVKISACLSERLELLEGVVLLGTVGLQLVL